MAHEHQLSLPPTLVGRADVIRLQRELEAVGDYLHQAALRKESPQSLKLPKTSRLLDDFVAVNKLNLLQRADYESGVELLQQVSKQAPVIHISFSAEPSSAFLAKLVAWLRQNIHPTVLVIVGLQPAIAAGCIVRTANKQFDLSLGENFKKNRELLVSQLRGQG